MVSHIQIHHTSSQQGRFIVVSQSLAYHWPGKISHRCPTHMAHPLYCKGQGLSYWKCFPHSKHWQDLKRRD